MLPFRRPAAVTRFSVAFGLMCLLPASGLTQNTGVPRSAPTLELMLVHELAYPEFVEPRAVAIGPLGQLFLADLGRGTVMRLDDDLAVAYEFESPPQQPDMHPLDLAVTGFQVYVLDAAANALLRYTIEGSYLDVLQSFQDERVETPVAVAVDGTGRVLLANAARHRVRIVNEAQETETSVGGFGELPGELVGPSGAAFAPDGSFFVSDTGNRRVQRFSGVGNLLRSPASTIGEPRGMDVGRHGELYVVDARDRALHVFTSHASNVLALDDFQPLDVCVYGDTVWVLSAEPPALLRVRVRREN